MSASDATAPVEKRRRPWRRAGLWSFAIILLLVGGRYAWTHRPLSAEERQMIGQWERVGSSENVIEVTFTPDRRFQATFTQLGALWSGESKGSWSLQGKEVLYDQDSRLVPLGGTLRERLVRKWAEMTRAQRWKTGDYLIARWEDEDGAAYMPISSRDDPDWKRIDGADRQGIGR